MRTRAVRTDSAEKTVRDIRRATRRQYSAEDKIRVVLEGLRGETSIAELCRKEGIAQSMYYGWSKEFLEAGKRRLAGDTAREATSDEVKTLRAEARQLKEALAEATLENRLLKKSVIADGEDIALDISHPRSSRSFELSRHRLCRSAARLRKSAFQSRRFTLGSTVMRLAASTALRIASPGQIGSGTASRTRSASGSLSSRSTSPSYPPVRSP